MGWSKKSTVEPCLWSGKWVLHEKLDSLILSTLNEHGNSHIRDICCLLFLFRVRKRQFFFMSVFVCSLFHSDLFNSKYCPWHHDLWVFHVFSMSEGMQRCHWSISASCLWHSSLFKSLLKHRTALYPPQRGRGVANIGLCFRLAWQPNSTSFHQEWSRMLMVACLLQSFQWFLQTSGCRQASVLICWSLSKQQAP